MIKTIHLKQFVTILSLGSIFYAPQLFAAAPMVQTKAATSVTASSAVLNASVISDGGHMLTAAGFQIGETTNYNNTVSAVVPTYAFESMFGSMGWGMMPGTFNQPMGIAISPLTGNIYIIEQNDSSSRVQIFNSNGIFQSQFGGTGSADGQFNTTGGITIGTEGDVYVSDYGNHRIQKFTADGSYISQFGTWGMGDGELYGPTGIAINSSGEILVVDTQNNRIQKFDAEGNYLSQFGSEGSGNGEFNLPMAIGVDTTDNIFVVDSYNHRVQKFNSDGVYLSQFGTHGSGNGEFVTPMDIDIDSSGQIVIADYGNSRVQIFNQDGTYQAQFGVYNGNNPVGGEFFLVGGVAIDSSGAIYASDVNNGRIQKFSRKFSASMTSLKCGKLFHFRAFATNSDGVGYGNDMTFSTPSCNTTIGSVARPTAAVSGINTRPQSVAPSPLIKK